MNNDVKGTLFGFICSFFASITWLDFAKELLVAFIFGAAGSLGGFIVSHLLIPYLKSKYDKYVKTNHKP
jgi:hypothetical protein